MLKHLVILLDDISTSYCHYINSKCEPKLLPLEILKKGILFAMKNNMRIQYVYPSYKLPSEYYKVIESMFHDNIGSIEQQANMGVIILNGLDELTSNIDILNIKKRYILRVTISDFLNNYSTLAAAFQKGLSINVVFIDVEHFSDSMIEQYQLVLDELGTSIKNAILNNIETNTNLITDRIILTEMNNCGAGDSCITLAPNGNFYPCPAFYYNDIPYGVIGNIEDGLDIKNKKLFTLEGAPLCKTCDAFHCKRCVFLNKVLTCEVNIPSRQQCVMAHIERNASKKLLNEFHQMKILEDKSIPEINYIDPFDKFQSI